MYILINLATTYTTVCLKKQCTRRSIITSANLDRFSKFFHFQISEKILYTSVIKILHLTLSMFLHYFVNHKNHNCCRFQWRIAHETSNHLSCKICGHLNSSDLNPMTTKSGSNTVKVRWKTLYKLHRELSWKFVCETILKIGLPK